MGGLSGVLATARARGTVWGYRAGWSAVRRMPERAAYRPRHRGRRIAAQRLQGVGADARELRQGAPRLDDAALDALVRAGMRSYTRYFCEAFRLPDCTHDDLDRCAARSTTLPCVRTSTRALRRDLRAAHGQLGHRWGVAEHGARDHGR